jgi:hypothetical protein
VNTAVTNGQLLVQNTIVSFTRLRDDDVIPLSGIAKLKNPDKLKGMVKNRLRSRSTLDILGIWEKIDISSFKGGGVFAIKSQARTDNIILSPKRGLILTCGDYATCKTTHINEVGELS